MRCSTRGIASSSASAAALPRLETRPALLRYTAGGWQANGIIQKQTGFPLTVTDIDRRGA